MTQVDATVSQKPGTGTRLARLLGLSFLVQWPFFVVAMAYALTTYWLLSGLPSYTQAPIKGLAMGIITLTLPAGVAAVFFFRLLQFALVIKPESPVLRMKDDVVGLVRRPQTFIMAVPLLVAMVIFNKGMLELKPMIPLLKPFSYDVSLMEIDRTLHFGHDPWTLLQPLLGHEAVTFAISTAYCMWFLVLFGTFMWFGFSRRSNIVRSQFFLAYMLTWWLGGGILALCFSSAGPAYYGLIGLSPDPYQPLMAYLHDVNTRLPLWALDAQQLLWDGYSGKLAPVGISAFPSMHNASALLFALAAFRLDRRAGWCLAAYAVLILVGSVHLGWHYAVDGYAAMLLALVMWWCAGIVARWHDRQASTLRLNEALDQL